jgi:Domain of unknown function (DUF6745)
MAQARDQSDDEIARDRILNGTAPPDLFVRRLKLAKITQPFELPPRLACYDLDLSFTSIERLPSEIRVLGQLNLSDCAQLVELPTGLETGALVLRNCVSLETLPENLSANFLDASGCVSLSRWPDTARVTIGSVNLRNARSLERLPILGPVTSLTIIGCTGIQELPEGTLVTSWLDIGGAAVRSLPASLKDVPLRWRGVRIDQRIAFHPETLKAEEVLTEANIEKRRVMLERIGYDRFFESARAEVLDCDTDPGGERKLMRVALPNDEALVCVSVLCPSTGRRYVVRVPPAMTTCRQAIAWTAGFENPDDYNPIVET